MEIVPEVFIPKGLLCSRGGGGIGPEGPGSGETSGLPKWFFGVFFFFTEKICVLFVQLKIHQDKKQQQQQRNFAFLEVNGGLISRKVKANLDKTETLPDTKM